MITDNMSEMACNTLDVSEAERQALTLTQSFQDLIVNYDMESFQYNQD